MKKLDPMNEPYVGWKRETGIPAVESTKELSPSARLEPWLERKAPEEREARLRAREFLDNAPDDEIIDLYYRMREEKVFWDGACFYPNMQVLFATPLEREKDRREIRQWSERLGDNEVVQWYKDAREKPCVWWVENHIIARHSFNSCMSCGSCTSLCPASEFFDYNPRIIMETVQEKNEDALVELLKSEVLWYCSQCGSCKTKCPRENSPFGLISSLRQLSQLKGYHMHSIRGRQQYAGRHLWGGNLWNRACSLYFRNPLPEAHKDFGPRFEGIYRTIEEEFRKVGVCPDMDGSLSGRKVSPETLEEVRGLWCAGGALFLWETIEEWGRTHAEELGLTIDEYHDKVKAEG
jgi:heterodisulfide reductase subunit C